MDLKIIAQVNVTIHYISYLPEFVLKMHRFKLAFRYFEINSEKPANYKTYQDKKISRSKVLAITLFNSRQGSLQIVFFFNGIDTYVLF